VVNDAIGRTNLLRKAEIQEEEEEDVISHSVSVAQFSVVVHDRETEFVSGPQISKG